MKRPKLPSSKLTGIIQNTTPKIVKTLLRDESVSGKLIIIFALIALVVVNSPFGSAYENIWQTYLTLGIDPFTISQDLRHWVNEGLMAFFFLVVGLEIKREVTSGELRKPKQAILPIAAAIGGMIVPAVIYFAFNLNPETIRGWGIPIATDIAFAVGVLSLLGKRVPLSLKLFLLTLAIVDDIGAIFVIALFYAEIINYYFLAFSFALVIFIWLMRKKLTNRVYLFMLLGIILWVTTHLSGIHASIVGAAMGLLAPVAYSGNAKSVNKQLEEWFLPVSTFIALPVFAFANAGVPLSWDTITNPASTSVMAGIIAGLIFGKLLGISGAAWLMVRLNLASLPSGIKWLHIVGVSLIAGIGFTVSIFITDLAFSNNQALVDTAKISIFIASGLAATTGLAILSIASIQQHKKR